MRRSLAMLAIVAVSACGGDANTSTTVAIGVGAESPVAAVEDLRVLLTSGDFGAASSLAVPNQAALASLAEGATIGQVADALESGDAEVAANFWGGFAQGVGDVFTGELAIEDSGTTSESGVEFFLVGVTPDAGVERLIITRDVDGHRIDIFASFGPVLAEQMIAPVELLLGTSSEDSRVTLSALQEIVPSLLVAATDESLSPDTVQSILQLIELITRVG